MLRHALIATLGPPSEWASRDWWDALSYASDILCPLHGFLNGVVYGLSNKAIYQHWCPQRLRRTEVSGIEPLAGSPGARRGKGGGCYRWACWACCCPDWCERRYGRAEIGTCAEAVAAEVAGAGDVGGGVGRGGGDGLLAPLVGDAPADVQGDSERVALRAA